MNTTSSNSVSRTLKGRAGVFHVWHVGPNDYRVTLDRDGAEIAQRTQFGLAFSVARAADDLSRRK